LIELYIFQTAEMGHEFCQDQKSDLHAILSVSALNREDGRMRATLVIAAVSTLGSKSSLTWGSERDERLRRCVTTQRWSSRWRD
jgi:hypothetical protein